MGLPIPGGGGAVLGQLAPAAATPGLLYTAPAPSQAFNSSGGASIGSIAFCETNGAAAKVRISIRVGGAADNIKQYVVYDSSLAGNGYDMWPKEPPVTGIPIGPGDLIYVQSDTGKVSFMVFGVPLA